MRWLTSTIVTATAAGAMGISSACQAQTVYTNASCEFNVTFPHSAITKEDESSSRTDFGAVPFLSAKCFPGPKACRFRQSLEQQLLSGLIAQFELKDYRLTNESSPSKGFLVSGVTTKENSLTRIEARVLFGDNSILVVAIVEPLSADKAVSTAFLQSAQRRPNAP